MLRNVEVRHGRLQARRAQHFGQCGRCRRCAFVRKCWGPRRCECWPAPWLRPPLPVFRSRWLRCVPRCVPIPCVPATAWKPRLETNWKLSFSRPFTRPPFTRACRRSSAQQASPGKTAGSPKKPPEAEGRSLNLSPTGTVSAPCSNERLNGRKCTSINVRIFTTRASHFRRRSGQQIWRWCSDG